MKVTSTATLAAVAALAHAEHFSVTQVAHGKSVTSGVVQLAHAMRKYGLSPDKNITDAEDIALAHGSVVTTPETYDSKYLTPVKIGSQTLMLDFDTGSSDLWVFSNEQPAAQRNGHTAYNCAPPRVSGAKWQIKYGDGSSAGGNVKKAAVTIAGLTVAGQEVECATHVAAQFVRDKMLDGLLGLGFDNINEVRPTKAKTWFTNIKPKLDAPVFAANLKHQAPGTYDFGYIDSTKDTGSLAYTTINPSEGYWLFEADGYSIGSGAEQAAFQAIADTGTSLILSSTAIVTAYYNQVPGSGFNSDVGGYIFPCSASLPSFSVYAGGAQHTTPGSYINYAFVGTSGGTRYCFGGIQSSGGLPFTILGDVFLKSQYVVFDTSVPRIGFAAQS